MVEYDLPDGWTCIECGDEFLSDTTGKEIADYTEGTLCKKCKEEDENILSGDTEGRILW